MNCNRCDHPNSAERNYCGSCGNLLVWYCSLCGFRNQAADRFCGGCGSALVEGAPTTARQASQPAPSARKPAAGSASAAIEELLEAAREAKDAPPEPGDIRVSQEDIDSLFGD